MKTHKTLILGRRTVEKLVDMKHAIAAIESAFAEYGRGRGLMPPKIYLDLPEFNGDFRAMPAYLPKLHKCSLKWVNAHPDNRRRHLPAVMAIIILSDPGTGLPLCIMDGTCATNLRTGAAGAVAAKHLARRDSSTVALVGCGVQAKTQLEALRTLFKIKRVKVWGKEKKLREDFIRRMKRKNETLIAAENVKECVKDADIIVTTTPSRGPVVRLKWLKAGVHINAIGADAQGKQELDPNILKKAKVVVDDWAQASHSGEINVPVGKKMISRKDIHAELGQIVCGKRKGRTSAKEITVFDSTGLAIQDVAVADLIYRSALRHKAGRCMDIVGI